jgi:hypothetical protein
MRKLMRGVATMLAAGALLAAPGYAITVETQLSEAFQTKLRKDYGDREAEVLQDDLRKKVERSFSASSVERIVVTIEDATPNRPTFQQLGDKPGLDAAHSFGIGGARVTGVAFNAAGAEVGRYDYDWYESDIRLSYGVWTWHDANRAFDRFARRFAKAVR